MRRIILYASGYTGIALFTQVVAMWAMYFYAPPADVGRIAYVPVATFGLILGMGRVIDAFTDPLVANWSDNFSSKWGRRIPFLALGGVPLSLFFILLWRPPVEGYAAVNSIYLFLVISLFFFCMTLVTCPFLALLPEIAGPRERITASTFLGSAYVLGLIGGTAGSSFLINNYNFATMGMILGFAGLLALYTPVISVRETGNVERKRFHFKKSLWVVLKNRAFLPFIVGQVFFWFAFNIIIVGLPYIVTIRMSMPEAQTGLALSLALIVTLVSFPLVSYTARVKGKKWTFVFVMFCSFAVLVGLATLGHWPGALELSAQGLIVIAIAGIPLAGLFILPNALIADISDYDAKHSGEYREAMYYAFYGMVMKGTIGISSFCLGLLLNTFGYSSGNPLGIYLIAPLAAISILAGLLVFRTYPLH